MLTSILAITGSRADWGLLAPVIDALRRVHGFRVRLAVTGQHLMPNMASVDAIRTEGFTVDHELDLGLESDDGSLAVTRAVARAIFGVGEILDRDRPDLMLVVGDRYEIFASATAALFAGVPVAHLCGGDVTEGAIDDSMRHAITKLAHLHFVSNEAAARRVAQLGEDPATIFLVGSPGLDRIRQTRPISRHEFFSTIGLTPRSRNLVVTFHPVTTEFDSVDQCHALLRALDSLEDTGIVITGCNADRDGRKIDRLMQQFAADREHVVFHGSLGSRDYISALTHLDAVIGNSSSGIYEAPSLGIPTVNIGDRQAGRLRAASVVDCYPNSDAIRTAIDHALVLACEGVVNPYGDGYAAERIVAALRNVEDPSRLLTKRFKDISPSKEVE